MDRVIDSGIETLNAAGRWFCSYAWNISLQVAVLIAALLVLDLLLKRRVRAVVRYAMWMLVFVKLLLPPALSLPTGIGYYRPDVRVASQTPAETKSPVQLPAPIAAAPQVDHKPPAVSPPAGDLFRARPVPTPAPPAASAPRTDTPAASASPAVVRPSLLWQAWLFLAWLAGVLTLSAYLLRRVQYIRRLIRQSAPASEELTHVLTECAARLRLRSCPDLRLSDDAPGPAVCGLFRPVVLMPASLARTLDSEPPRTVLVHELAHIRRADLWINFAQTLLLVAYFFHPLLWLAHAIVRRLREKAVDETVLVALDAEAESYGATLIDLAEMPTCRPTLGLRLIGIAESKKALEGRIRHMITRPKPKTAKLGLAGLLTIAVTAAALLPMARGETEGGRQRFVAKLPDGVTVELLGVCNWPTKEPVCWKPDGSSLDPPLRAAKSHVSPAAHRYGFMLRVTAPEDRDLRWNRIEGAGGWEGSCDVVTADGKRLDDCTAAVADMESPGQQTSLRIGVATGPWTTISTYDGKSSAGRSGSVLWSRAFNDSGTACIVATAEWLKDRTTRIIAIDNRGATHTTPRGSISQGNMDQMTARFYNLRPDQIREFQYQVRPYQWVQFENVSLRPGHMTSIIVEPRTNDVEMPSTGDTVTEPDRDFSRTQLSALGKVMLIYANEHDDQLPETLADVQDDIEQAGDLSLSWVWENVAYLGRGMTTSNEPDDPVAYDRTLYEQGGGANVLYLDTHVAFETPERLEELGIAPDKPSPAALRDSARRLRALGRSLVIYAKGHDDTFPNTLDDLQSVREPDPMLQIMLQIYGMSAEKRPMDVRLLAAYREHVQYLGKGVKANDDPAGVLAYDETLLAEGKGTNVLHVDATVDFVTPERFKELMPAKAAGSLPDIFVLSPSNPGFNVFDAVNTRTRDWTWNKTGRYHDREAYDRIFDGADHRTSRDILVLVFTLESADRIPAGYEDLLPMPWDRIEQQLRQGHAVEMAKEARDLHVILLAAPDSSRLKRLIAQSKLLADSKEIARSTVAGCDVAVEDFKVEADPDLGTFRAVASIRNQGTAACPKIAVHFYRGDPDIANPMMHGAGSIEPGQTWNESSSQFGLREGDNEVCVVLDPANLVAEPDEANNRATLRVIVRDGGITEQSIAPAETPEVSPGHRIESQMRLNDLGKAVLFYAVEHDGKLPEALIDIRPQFGVGFSWLYDHVEYLGRGMTTQDNPERPIAYDQTLFLEGNGTNVLYLNSQVPFESPARLEELSNLYVEEREVSAEAQRRAMVMSRLKQLALAAIMYADTHGNTAANDLAELEPYIRDDELFTWAKENAEYVGKGAVRGPGNEGFKTPVFYWKNPPATINGTAVAFWDGHVETVDQARLEALGIEIQR